MNGFSICKLSSGWLIVCEKGGPLQFISQLNNPTFNLTSKYCTHGLGSKRTQLIMMMDDDDGDGDYDGIVFLRKTQ